MNEYGQLDPFRGIDVAEVERVRQIATLLEQRGQSAEEVAVRTAYLDLLAIQPGERPGCRLWERCAPA